MTEHKKTPVAGRPSGAVIERNDYLKSVADNATIKAEFSKIIFDDTPRPWFRVAYIDDLPEALPVTLHRVAKESHPTKRCRLWYVSTLFDSATLAEPWNVPRGAVLPAITAGRPSVRVWGDRELEAIGRQSEPLLAATLRQRAGLATLGDEALLGSDRLARLIGRLSRGEIGESQTLKMIGSDYYTRLPVSKAAREALTVRVGLFGRFGR